MKLRLIDLNFQSKFLFSQAKIKNKRFLYA